jgi:predicted phosphohydrolase
MRVVAVADTHRWEKDLTPVPDGDLFVHAGDLLDFGSLEELQPVARWLRALPHRHKVLVAGNHDWCFARPEERERAIELLGPDVHYLEDSALELDGLSIYGSPWQPEFGGWAFNLPRGEALRARWAAIPTGVDLLITHGPPHGYGDETWHGHAGCEELLVALDRVQPLLHVFGHIHEAGGLFERGGVRIANVTTASCERPPTVIDVDPVRGAVNPVTVPARRRRA